jgi:hypothetical protein
MTADKPQNPLLHAAGIWVVKQPSVEVRSVGAIVGLIKAPWPR